jgi:hypothetical protein
VYRVPTPGQHRRRAVKSCGTALESKSETSIRAHWPRLSTNVSPQQSATQSNQQCSFNGMNNSAVLRLPPAGGSAVRRMIDDWMTKRTAVNGCSRQNSHVTNCREGRSGKGTPVLYSKVEPCSSQHALQSNTSSHQVALPLHSTQHSSMILSRLLCESEGQRRVITPLMKRLPGWQRTPWEPRAEATQRPRLPAQVHKKQLSSLVVQNPTATGVAERVVARPITPHLARPYTAAAKMAIQKQESYAHLLQEAQHHAHKTSATGASLPSKDRTSEAQEGACAGLPEAVATGAYPPACTMGDKSAGLMVASKRPPTLAAHKSSSPSTLAPVASDKTLRAGWRARHTVKPKATLSCMQQSLVAST